MITKLTTLAALSLMAACDIGASGDDKTAGSPGVDHEEAALPEGAADYTKVDATATTPVQRGLTDPLSTLEPINQISAYVVGAHPMKDHPNQQMTAHHYCIPKTPDFVQCVLFDGNTKDANMNGIEYIISKKAFDALPDAERKFWHPHNAEILSGALAAPGLSEADEHALMKNMMNSYGKTWHTWMSNPFEGEPDALPIGEPMLAWSLNREGEALPGLMETRDEEMQLDTKAMSEARQDLVPLAEPQYGVDALKGQFGRETKEIPGVKDAQ